MGEIWAAIGLSSTLTIGVMAFLLTQVSTRLGVIEARLDAMDAKFSSRLDAQSDRLDRVIEMLAQHEHR